MQEPEPDPFMTQSDTEKDTEKDLIFPTAPKSLFDSFEFEHEVPDEYSICKPLSGHSLSTRASYFSTSIWTESQQKTLRDLETRFSCEDLAPVTI